MKVNDLRKLSDKDLLSRLVDNKESLQKYRFQKSIQQLEDYKVLSDLRKENARINTILKENLEIVDIDKENNLLYVKGAIPGANNAPVFILKK